MSPHRKAGPPVRKGAAFPFQISIVCWIDLLGYGAMIAEADFNPLHQKAADAMSRLRLFHKVVASHSNRYLPTLVMNDGAVAYRDLSLRSRGPTQDFLVRVWDLFTSINDDEKQRGFPGARAVLATGFRMRGRRAGMEATSSQFSSVIRRFANGDIDANEAIREAAHIRQSFDIVPELQANFAFSKAYVAGCGGSAAGLGGANFFVDLAIFQTKKPDWVVSGATVDWSNEKLCMKASFAPILQILPCKHAEGGSLDLRDGLEVAQHLTHDANVLDALRNAAKPPIM
jgi:hypothetical protein